MPVEGEPKAVSDVPTPSSEKTSSSKDSPDEEQKSKESSKTSPESSEVKYQSSLDDPSLDEPLAAVPDDQRELGHPGFYQYVDFTISSDEDGDSDDDDLASLDDEWVASYSDDSNPHWIAIQETCDRIMDNARAALANCRLQLKKNGRDFDLRRLTRATSHLNVLTDDLAELVVATTPESMSSTSVDEIDNVAKLIQHLAGPGFKDDHVDDVIGKVDARNLAANYRGHALFWKGAAEEMYIVRKMILHCLYLFETHRTVFREYCSQTNVFRVQRGTWMTVPMEEKDLKEWNREMKGLVQVASRLCSYVVEIEGQLMQRLHLYLMGSRELKRQLSMFMSTDDPNTFIDKI